MNAKAKSSIAAITGYLFAAGAGGAGVAAAGGSGQSVDWERLISAIGVPAAVLFFLLFAGWRTARALAPYLPTIVGALRAHANAVERLSEHSTQHTQQLNGLRQDVGAVRSGVDTLVARAP